MNVEHYLIAKLADAMYAAGKTKGERMAIGCVVRNRAQDLSDWHEAIESMKYWHKEKNPHSPEFLDCLWSAEEVFYNRTPDITYGAMKFCEEPMTGAVCVGRWFFYKNEIGVLEISVHNEEAGYLEVFESD